MLYEVTYVVKFEEAEIGYNGWSVSSSVSTKGDAESFKEALVIGGKAG